MLSPSQHPSPQSRGVSSGWQERLNEAVTPAEVVDVARDFLALWTPSELGHLPRECRPGKLVDAEDINGLAFALAQHSCARDRISDNSLHRLAFFFTEASQRLASMHASPPPSDPGEPPRQ